MTTGEILRNIEEILMELVGMSGQEIKGTDVIRKEIPLDDENIKDFVMELEKVFSIDIPEDEAEKHIDNKSIDDIIGYINAKIVPEVKEEPKKEEKK